MHSISATRRLSKGFTLIELLVVISIIGLLSSVVLAAVNGARAKGAVGAGQKFDQYTHTAFYDDLVLSWDFNNDSGSTVQDVSGNGNNLLLSFATLDTTPNPFATGKVITLDQSASPFSKTAVLPSPMKRSPSGDFSVSFWVYPTSAQQTTFLTYGYSAALAQTWRIGVFSAGGSLSFNFSTGSTPLTVTAGTLQPNQWHHVAAVCTSAKMGIYINGKLTGTTDAATGCGFAANRSLTLGADNGSLEYHLDNVRIYARALPLSFIQEQYARESLEARPLAQDASVPHN